jgi:hypothetical protein
LSPHVTSFTREMPAIAASGGPRTETVFGKPGGQSKPDAVQLAPTMVERRGSEIRL